MNRDAFNRAIVTEARRWIGTPYHHQQSEQGFGVDCLGLVRGVWRAVCGPELEDVPNYASSWKLGGDDKLLQALQRNMEPVLGVGFGRVLAFRYRQGLPVSHLAISTGETSMVHAYHGRGAMEVNISGWWTRRMVARFEFPMEAAYV